MRNTDLGIIIQGSKLDSIDASKNTSGMAMDPIIKDHGVSNQLHTSRTIVEPKDLIIVREQRLLEKLNTQELASRTLESQEQSINEKEQLAHQFVDGLFENI